MQRRASHPMYGKGACLQKGRIMLGRDGPKPSTTVTDVVCGSSFAHRTQYTLKGSRKRNLWRELPFFEHRYK